MPRRAACSSRLYHWVVIMTKPGETDDCQARKLESGFCPGVSGIPHTYLKQPEEDTLDDEALIGLDYDRQNDDDAPKEAAEVRRVESASKEPRNRT